MYCPNINAYQIWEDLVNNLLFPLSWGCMCKKIFSCSSLTKPTTDTTRLFKFIYCRLKDSIQILAVSSYIISSIHRYNIKC